MKLETEDFIQAIRSIQTSNTSINAEFEETVKQLDKIYNLKYKPAPPGFHENIELMRKYFREMQELATNKSYQKQIEVCKLLRISIESFRLKYVDFLPNELPKEFEQLEENIKSIEANTAINLLISSLANVTNLQSEEFNQINLLKIILDSLNKFLKNIENYRPYIQNKILKNIEKLIILSIAELEGYETDKDEEKEVLNNAKIMAKAILWEINNKKNSVEKFNNIDEIWNYWLDKYDEEEIESSLKLFQEGIDQERNNQGGRTLFS